MKKRRPNRQPHLTVLGIEVQGDGGLFVPQTKSPGPRRVLVSSPDLLRESAPWQMPWSARSSRLA